MILRKACAAALAGALFAQPVLAQTLVGQTDKVVNSVVGKLQDRQRALVKADSVYLNEALDTGGQSATEVSFRDSTKLTVGPNSSVVLDAFVFDPDPTRGRMALSMTKGVLRFTSGTMPSQVYSVRTPTALIGVRGTIFTVVVADGVTTLTVEQGLATISNLAGVAQGVSAGQASSVAPGAPPTPPGAPPAAANTAVGQMDTVIAQAPGAPAGASASAQGIGGLGVVGGAVGLAALIAIAVAASGDDDDDEQASATATSASPGTN